MNNYQDYFENAGIALLIIDEEGVICQVNRQFENFSEIKQEQIINKLSLSDFVIHDERETIQSLLRTKFQDTTLPYSVACTFVSMKRQQRPALLTMNFLSGRKQIICSFVDTIPVKRAEFNTQQEIFQKELGKIASGIAHEIRNPLSAINTSIEILRDSLLVTGEDQELMKIILEENKRLDQIIKEFSYFARLSDPDISLADINELIEETVAFARQNVSADISISAKLLETPPPMYFDASQIKTVFFNVMDNAIEAMPEGGLLEITTRIAKNEFNDEVLAVCFSDSGEGIDADDLENVFKPFFSNKENHSGMGLSISQRIIEKHRGKIQIESKPDAGTRVTIYIPIIFQEIISEQTPGLI
ncbi:MAG: PAS domain-containing protein [Calditrichaeota bacterium]|nr:PAS domain-containing protein [Calditrichota bacterium]